MESELAELTGHLAAATYRFLQLLAEFDDRDGWAGPACLAAATVLIVGIVVLATLVTLAVSAVAGSLTQITQSVTTGIQSIRDWVAGPPFNLGDTQLNSLVEEITTASSRA